MRQIKPEFYVVLIVLIGGTLAILNALKIYASTNEAKSWPHVNGTIISTDVRIGGRNGNCRIPELSYMYFVKNTKYEGTRVRMEDTCLTENEASSYKVLYTPLKRVNVFFNPEKPESSILEPGKAWWNTTLQLILGITFVLIWLVLGFHIYRK